MALRRAGRRGGRTRDGPPPMAGGAGPGEREVTPLPTAVPTPGGSFPRMGAVSPSRSGRPLWSVRGEQISKVSVSDVRVAVAAAPGQSRRAWSPCGRTPIRTEAFPSSSASPRRARSRRPGPGCRPEPAVHMGPVRVGHRHARRPPRPRRDHRRWRSTGTSTPPSSWSVDGERRVLSARPSDAIALALRALRGGDLRRGVGHVRPWMRGYRTTDRILRLKVIVPPSMTTPARGGRPEQGFAVAGRPTSRRSGPRPGTPAWRTGRPWSRSGRDRSRTRCAEGPGR